MKTAARILLTIILVAAGCVGGYELWDYYMFSPWTRDARVQADVVSIAPDVSGFVDEVRVKDNQFVHKGDILVVLDRERYSRALATAAVSRPSGRTPLSTLRRSPRGHQRMTRGQCGSLDLHWQRLALFTPCRSPGARTVNFGLAPGGGIGG